MSTGRTKLASMPSGGGAVAAPAAAGAAAPAAAGNKHTLPLYLKSSLKHISRLFWCHWINLLYNCHLHWPAHKVLYSLAGFCIVFSYMSWDFTGTCWNFLNPPFSALDSYCLNSRFAMLCIKLLNRKYQNDQCRKQGCHFVYTLTASQM